jgi:CBS domain-containing protein
MESQDSTVTDSSWVSSAVSKDFARVTPEDYVSSCIGKMQKTGKKAVVIVDDKDGDFYLGMVTERVIARSLLDPQRTKVKTVMRKVPPISENSDIEEAARRMVELGVTMLPVVKNGKLIGVLDESNVLDLVAGSRLGGAKLSQMMTKAVVTIDKDDSIGKALSLMRHNGVTRLPVMDGPKVVGMVTLNDVLEKVIRPKLRMERGWGSGRSTRALKDPVSRIMSSPVIYLGPDETVAKAISVMTSNGISSLLVLNDLGELLGIVTKHDALRLLKKKPQVEEGLNVHVSVKTPGGTEEFDTKRLSGYVSSLARKFGKELTGSELSVFVKNHREQRRGRRLVHIRLVLTGPVGSYASVGEGWGDNQALQRAMEGLERQLLRKKEGSKETEAGHKSIYDVLSLFY